ncbi:hypothetical protein EIN_081950 [Entamoeba invadens IP1]|uniref:hypothetical protein n=1 Tax=Entamoeba invadens IP1 TaxID=370355 RepID=UPI0002C3FA11|nr:hypothetical protein EIN_081950 [Entamoeba invadens IP1]ELP85153.1 hypothetical protein EIN_081950 [Entamoeba invadens IP1]|eukprot:XP_004184499.1 hypothetical protein EIN_081950 [Entamoeba invadens IP1]
MSVNQKQVTLKSNPNDSKQNKFMLRKVELCDISSKTNPDSLANKWMCGVIVSSRQCFKNDKDGTPEIDYEEVVVGNGEHFVIIQFAPILFGSKINLEKYFSAHRKIILENIPVRKVVNKQGCVILNVGTTRKPTEFCLRVFNNEVKYVFKLLDLGVIKTEVPTTLEHYILDDVQYLKGEYYPNVLTISKTKEMRRDGKFLDFVGYVVSFATNFCERRRGTVFVGYTADDVKNYEKGQSEEFQIPGLLGVGRVFEVVFENITQNPLNKWIKVSGYQFEGELVRVCSESCVLLNDNDNEVYFKKNDIITTVVEMAERKESKTNKGFINALEKFQQSLIERMSATDKEKIINITQNQKVKKELGAQTDNAIEMHQTSGIEYKMSELGEKKEQSQITQNTIDEIMAEYSQDHVQALNKGEDDNKNTESFNFGVDDIDTIMETFEKEEKKTACVKEEHGTVQLNSNDSKLQKEEQELIQGDNVTNPIVLDLNSESTQEVSELPTEENNGNDGWAEVQIEKTARKTLCQSDILKLRKADLLVQTASEEDFPRKRPSCDVFSSNFNNVSVTQLTQNDVLESNSKLKNETDATEKTKTPSEIPLVSDDKFLLSVKIGKYTMSDTPDLIKTKIFFDCVSSNNEKATVTFTESLIEHLKMILKLDTKLKFVEFLNEALVGNSVLMTVTQRVDYETGSRYFVCERITLTF